MRARVPADIDMPDRILGGLTARQLVILSGVVLALWASWLSFGRHLQPFVFGLIGAPLAAIGVVWALVPIHGSTPERVAAAALRHLGSPRRRVLAPEGIPSLPRWWRPRAGRVGPSGFPVRSVTDGGHVNLGADGAVLVARASSVNFALRSEEEQIALVDGFGRLLNSLDVPVQFVLRSERVDVRGIVQGMLGDAPGLPHPALEAAAREHAEFLDALAARGDVLTRRALVCLRTHERVGAASAALLDRRAEETTTLLRGMGITLRRLNVAEVATTLARAADPSSLPTETADAGEIVRGA